MPDVTSSDLSFLLMCALRYALGRQSYAPSYIAEMVTRYIDGLTQGQRDLLAYDIRCHLAKEFGTPEPADIRQVWIHLEKKLKGDP